MNKSYNKKNKNTKILNKLFKKKKQKGGSIKWTTLEHNGVLFPAEYEPHNKPLKFQDKNINLTTEQEECAMMYAKYIDTEYIENRTFNKNFWNDWKKKLGKDSEINNLEDCDFTEYKKILIKNKETEKNIIQVNSDDIQNKDNNILETELSRVNYNIDAKEEEKYKIAHVDGKIQPVGNYRMEPPGIFLGRGDNPKIGKIKPRI